MPPCARASASLDRLAPSPYLTATFPPRDELRMALLEILQAPHPVLKTRGRSGGAGRRPRAPARRRHVRDHVQGAGDRTGGTAGRRLRAAGRPRRRRRRGAPADGAGQPRDRLALRRADHRRGGLPQPARPVRRRHPAESRSRSAISTRKARSASSRPRACSPAASSTRSTISTASCSSTTSPRSSAT